MDIILGIIIGLLVLMILIVGHEFGHFLLARKNGVRVKEFGIGFPPRAVAWRRINGKWIKYPKSEWKNGNEVLKAVGNDKSEKKSETTEPLILSLNWLPIGGFCQMNGESDADTKKGTFGAASYWSKTKILFGGVAMNWLMAFLILTVLAWTGMPLFLENQFTITSDEHIERLSYVEVVAVAEGSPAEAAGFKVGDKVLSENGEDIYSAYSVASRKKFQGGETVEYKIEREDNKETLTATLNSADADYLLGVTMQGGGSVNKYTWSAPLVALGTTAQLTGETFKGLGKMLINLITGAARQVSLDASTRE